MAYRLTSLIILLLLTSTALAGEPRWFLMSREDGCQPLELLTRREQLPRTPASPREFAAMMEAKGYGVTTALPEGFPAELAGKVLQVRVRDNLAPLFVTEELCRQMEEGR